MKILITSGGTKVPIDTVRHIGNMSKGTFAGALAREFLKLKHDVFMFRSASSVCPIKLAIDLRRRDATESYEAAMKDLGHNLHRYTEQIFDTFNSYAKRLPAYVGAIEPDVVIAAAAVSDFILDPPFDSKISSQGRIGIELKLVNAPKVLPTIRAATNNKKMKLVGFKLLDAPDEKEKMDAIQRVMSTGPCDMVAYNDIQDLKNGHRRYELYYPDRNPIKIHEPKVDFAPGHGLAEQFSKLVLEL